MITNIEKLEGNMAKLTIEVSAEDFAAAVTKAYQKQKNQFNVPGFRKGKVPQAYIEKAYGAAVFYDEAANIVLNDSYPEAAETEEFKALKVSSRPEIDLVQCEKGQAFIYTATVAVKPVVTLGAYKELGIAKDAVEVTDEEVIEEIKKEQDKNSRTVTVDDRAVVSGDTANIDFEGFVDDVAFEGGKGENYDLVIGSGSFIPGFEDQIIGHAAGEEFDVNVTFPEGYQAENLAGKPAVFKVKVNSITMKELPELDDEFVSEISDFETVDAYKESVKTKLAESKQAEADRKYEDEVVRKVVENAEMVIPQVMIDERAQEQVDGFKRQLMQQGISYEMYMQYFGQTEAQMVDQAKDSAKQNLENRLVLEAVAEAEGFEASEEDIEAEIAKMAESYGMTVEDLKNYTAGNSDFTDQLAEDIKVQKALKCITE